MTQLLPSLCFCAQNPSLTAVISAGAENSQRFLQRAVAQEEWFCCNYPSYAVHIQFMGEVSHQRWPKGPHLWALRCWWYTLWTVWGFFGFFLSPFFFFLLLVGFCFLLKNKKVTSHADLVCTGQGLFWAFLHSFCSKESSCSFLRSPDNITLG